MYEYKVVSINKIIDGDTVDLTIDLGFNLHKTDRYRLAGFDAPETFRPLTDKEKAAGEATKAHLAEIMPYSAGLLVKTQKDTDIYGRYSCILYYSGSITTVNNLMLEYILKNNYIKAELRK